MTRARLGILLAVVLTALLSPPAAAATNHAAIAVRDGTGEVETKCVAFTEDTIDGLELLERSGFDYEVQQMGPGTAVCRIGPDGCGGGEDCWCEFPEFWGYWTRAPKKAWTFSQIGAGARKVRNGSMDGWSWGKDGKPGPPKDVSFASVCGSTAGTTSSSTSASPDLEATEEPTAARPRTVHPRPSAQALADVTATDAPPSETGTRRSSRPTTRLSRPTQSLEAIDAPEVSSSNDFVTFGLVAVLFVLAGLAVVFRRRRAGR